MRTIKLGNTVIYCVSLPHSLQPVKIYICMLKSLRKGGNEEMLGYKFQLCKMSFGNSVYSVVMIVNSPVLDT